MIYKKVSEVSTQVSEWKKKSLIVGLVPTMGSLHQGHLSLVEKAREVCDKVIVSIFVNPTQFNEKDDFDKYPRDESADINFLNDLADAIFIPSVEEMYPNKNHLIQFDFGPLERVMEGKYREGHFNGVGVVVSKLFNICSPDKAFFGQKDLQQYAIIEKLKNDLSFQIDLVCCDIVRENDGLAMSSRNKRLSLAHRKKAVHIYNTLSYVAGIFPPESIETALRDGKIFFSKEDELRLDYLEIVDQKTLQAVTKKTTKIAICIAAFLGDVRLIDNLLLEVE